MILKYNQYTGTPEDIAPDRFTLTETKEVTAKRDSTHVKKGDKNIREVIIGHGYTFETMVNKIIRLELAARNEVATLRDYIDAFKDLTKKIILK